MSDDPLDRLRAANPVPDVAAVRLPAGDIPGLIIRGRHRRRLRRALWIVPVVVVGSAGLAAAILTSHDTNPLDVACYSAAAPDADVTVVDASDAASAIDTCAELWRSGEVGAGPVPPLRTCTLPSGHLAVVPDRGPRPCADVVATTSTTGTGSTPPSTTGAPDDPAAVRALRDDLVAVTLAERCLTPAASRREAVASLRRHGLDGWDIEIGPGQTGEGFSGERPCATYAIEPATKTITLVPSPAR